MDQNLTDAKNNIGEAKDDIKELITDKYDAAKSKINSHIDEVADATKEVISEVAKHVGSAADLLVVVGASEDASGRNSRCCDHDLRNLWMALQFHCSANR